MDDLTIASMTLYDTWGPAARAAYDRLPAYWPNTTEGEAEVAERVLQASQKVFAIMYEDIQEC